MQRIYSCFLLLIATINLSAQHWVQVNSPVVSPNVLNSVSFRDANHGISGGGSSATLSANGVQSFIKSANNGGVNWANAFPNCGDLIQTVQYFNPLNAYILANHTSYALMPIGQFLKSTDDASTFNCITLPRYDSTNSHQAFTAIKMFFTDTVNGFIVGNDWDNSSGPSISGQILKTSNGGQTWSHCLPALFYNRGAIHEVFFANSQVGYAIGDSIYKTTNGGLTWSNFSLSFGQYISSLYFSNPSIGWAAGNNGALYKTTNGGQTWSLITIYSSDNFVKVSFTDSLHGWVAGGTHIYHSTDGGANWLCADTLAATITDLCMVNNSLGFAVGGNSVFKYSCPTVAITNSHSICAGNSYTVGNETFNTGGNFDINLLNSSCGCDSLVHLSLTVNPLPTPTVNYSNGHFTTQSYSNYQWLYNGASVTGGNNQNYSPIIAGSYSVIVTDANGCIDTSAAMLFTSIDNVTDNKFRIYPNPTTDFLTIDGVEPKTIINITNELGENVMRGICENSKKVINVSQLPSGVYFINEIKFLKY